MNRQIQQWGPFPWLCSASPGASPTGANRVRVGRPPIWPHRHISVASRARLATFHAPVRSLLSRRFDRGNLEISDGAGPQEYAPRRRCVFRSLTGQLRNTAHLLPLVLSIVALVVLAIAMRGSLLVLLLPFAGAAMFHGWFGSASAVYLFAAGTVAAFAAYWLGLWALLRVAEPSMASLVAAALVVVPSEFFAARRHTKLSDILGRSGASWWWACVIFGLVFASIYVSSTPLVEFSETRIFHVPLVASMSRGNVPPINLSEPPNPLYYHYGQHVFAATLHTLSGLPAHLACLSPMVVSLPWPPDLRRLPRRLSSR